MKLDSKILYYEESGGEYFYNKIFNKFAIFDTNKFSELKLERLFNKNIKGLVEHLDFVLKKITYIDNSLENVSHSSFIKEYFEKQIMNRH